ncbi:transferase 2, rSAM/selenodomain-associated [Arenibacter nanhaiticus]|uniref:Transferase 2, rSAM/selenodomain-associated n=1 Tax=Arenibacter nanhaiticus TaxID=558155 RepID=A0A1M6I263_9FLAO|nr:TIGR04283 family arsenosugar biosynthesis glycosyltransferase [Arenibacter nanhaiticus]SHJ28573.1 transferase 2, rSAM/selenodomain-associated [Arenibacter nanhaiticus]
MKNNNQKTISIIIPVLNEEKHLRTLIDYLKANSNKANIEEIMVIDGGSEDQSASIAMELGVRLLKSEKGRAKQMNHGAKHALGDILYFLHVDTFPPNNFDQHILKEVDQGYETGCFRMVFDSRHWFLRFFAFLSRLNLKICRGGDQSLYITKALFQSAKGYNEQYIIYEDSEFIGRLYQMTAFKVMPQNVTTSARKYRQIGLLRLQYHFGVIHLKNMFGAGPDKLYDYYRRKIVS